MIDSSDPHSVFLSNSMIPSSKNFIVSLYLRRDLQVLVQCFLCKSPYLPIWDHLRLLIYDHSAPVLCFSCQSSHFIMNDLTPRLSLSSCSGQIQSFVLSLLMTSCLHIMRMFLVLDRLPGVTDWSRARLCRNESEWDWTKGECWLCFQLCALLDEFYHVRKA